MPTSSIPLVSSLPETDLSNIAFSKLFGENWYSITERADTFVGPLIPILKEMNLILMTAVVGWTLYSVVVGSVGTASEGSVGGKKFNSFWWPVRATFGISMTAPLTASGLSLFQVLILSMLGWACSFANSIYYKSIDNLAASNFAVLSAEAPPQVQINALEAARVIYKASFAQNFIVKQQQDVVDDHLRLELPPPYTPWKYTRFFEVDKIETEGSPRRILQFSSPPRMDPDGFGGFTIPGPADDHLARASYVGLMRMCSIIYPVTLRMVYGEEVDKGWLAEAVNVYESTMLEVYTQFGTLYPQHDLSQDVSAFKRKAKELGWMAAGASPLLMSSMSQEMQETMNQVIHIEQPDYSRLNLVVDDQKYHAFSVAQASAFRRLDQERGPEQTGTAILEAVKNGDPGGVFASVMNFFSGRSFLQSLLSRLESEDPSLVIGQYGHRIINAGIVAWSAGLGIYTAKGCISDFNDSTMGKVVSFFTGGISESAVGGASHFVDYIIQWLGIICFGLFTIGAVFAWVIPAIPTLYWILAMVGFVLLVVEIMVAAPFWAAAHAWSTQDEGFAGEMGKQGYFQFLEILFRPALYILGFIAIFLIMRVAGWLIARIFEAFYFSYANTDFGLTGGTTTGLLTSIVMSLMICAIYLYMFIYLCSEGYSHLPRKVMAWIGHQSASMGISGASEGMRQMIVGGISKGTRSRKSGPGLNSQSKAEKENKTGGGSPNKHGQGETEPGTGGSGFKLP